MDWWLKPDWLGLRRELYKGTPAYYPEADHRPYHITTSTVRSRPTVRGNNRPKFCGHCHEPIDQTDQFCAYCGRPVEPIERLSATAQMAADLAVCLCLTILREQDEYCPSCGTVRPPRR